MCLSTGAPHADRYSADERTPVRFVDDPELAFIIQRYRQVWITSDISRWGKFMAQFCGYACFTPHKTQSVHDIPTACGRLF
jgi:hypothetical protein